MLGIEKKAKNNSNVKINRTALGLAIAQRRKQLNISQRQLADAINVTQSAVSKTEVGETIPDYDLIFEYAEVLKVSPGFLLMKLVEGIEPNLQDAGIEPDRILILDEKTTPNQRRLAREIINSWHESIFNTPATRPYKLDKEMDNMARKDSQLVQAHNDSLVEEDRQRSEQAQQRQLTESAHMDIPISNSPTTPQPNNAKSVKSNKTNKK